MKNKVLVCVSLLLLCLTAIGVANAQQRHHNAKLPPANTPVSLFGTHMSVPTPGNTYPTPPNSWFGQLRLWDSDTNWYQIELSPVGAITSVGRVGTTSTITFTLGNTTDNNWAVGQTAFVNVQSSNQALQSFNGLYTITSFSVQGTTATLQYTQSGQQVNSTVATGTINDFDFSELDTRLSDAAWPSNPSLQVMYTFGKVPPFYSSNQMGLCPSQYGNGSAPAGTCYMPMDLSPDGTGANNYWRLFVTGLAEHIASLNSSYVQPMYFETWNEFNGNNYWNYNSAPPLSTDDAPRALIRLMDDAACVINGKGFIHMGDLPEVPCGSATGFIKTGILPNAQILPPCVSGPERTVAWSNLYNAYSDSLKDADIIGVHTYGYEDNNQAIQSISVSGNSEVVAVSDTSNFVINDYALISGVSNLTLNGTLLVTNVSSTAGTITVQKALGANGGASGSGFIQSGPDQLQAALQAFESVLTHTGDSTKPLWVTEGYSKVIDPLAYIVRWYTILWSSGVKRANWYTWNYGDSRDLWDTTQASGDIACDGSGHPQCNKPECVGCTNTWGYVNTTGQGYGVAENWLTSASLSSCSNTGSVWTCSLTSGTSSELMVWDSSHDRGVNGTNTSYNASGYSAYIDLTGNITTCSPCNSVTINSRPILFVH